MKPTSHANISIGNNNDVVVSGRIRIDIIFIDQIEMESVTGRKDEFGAFLYAAFAPRQIHQIRSAERKIYRDDCVRR